MDPSMELLEWRSHLQQTSGFVILLMTILPSSRPEFLGKRPFCIFRVRLISIDN